MTKVMEKILNCLTARHSACLGGTWGEEGEGGRKVFQGGRRVYGHIRMDEQAGSGRQSQDLALLPDHNQGNSGLS